MNMKEAQEDRCVDSAPHNYVFLRQIKKNEGYEHEPRWKMYDSFYCSKCLQIKEIKSQ